VKNKGIPDNQYGKVFVFAYAFGDRLVVHNNWINENDTLTNFDHEKQFSLEESLHGREILAACSLTLHSGRKLVITGCEDTFIKASEYT
jgi:hypothetical protein